MMLPSCDLGSKAPPKVKGPQVSAFRLSKVSLNADSGCRPLAYACQRLTCKITKALIHLGSVRANSSTGQNRNKEQPLQRQLAAQVAQAGSAEDELEAALMPVACKVDVSGFRYRCRELSLIYRGFLSG